MQHTDIQSQVEAGDLPKPGIIARMRFLGQRHPVAASLVIGLFIGAGGVLCFAMLAGIAMEGRAGLMLIYSALNFSVACILAAWLLASRQRANPNDIAAAFAAASGSEKLCLADRLQARLASKTYTEPMTAQELASIFNSVRSEHGLPARRRERAADDRKRLAKRLESLAEGASRA
jgi:hypothetical protein